MGGEDMALTINTNIKNDADGYLLYAEAVRVNEDGTMLPAMLAKITEVESVDALPENPNPNVLYLIREES